MKEKRMFIEDDIEEQKFQKLLNKTESDKEIDDLIQKRIEEGLMYKIK